MQTQAAKDARLQRAMQDITTFYGKQGVVLSPDAARELAEADEQGPNAPPGTVDAMIATATETTVPTGDEMAASPVDNGMTRNTPGIRSRVTEKRLPNSACPAVAPRQTMIFGRTSSISMCNHGMHAAISEGIGRLCRRRLPRGSHLKCLTTLVT